MCSTPSVLALHMCAQNIIWRRRSSEAVRSSARLCMQCTSVHVQCTCSAHAVHITCSAHAVRTQCTRNAHARAHVHACPLECAPRRRRVLAARRVTRRVRRLTHKHTETIIYMCIYVIFFYFLENLCSMAAASSCTYYGCTYNSCTTAHYEHLQQREVDEP